MSNGASLKLASLVLTAYLCALVVLCTPRSIPRPLLWAAPPAPSVERHCGRALSPPAATLRMALRSAFAAELAAPRDRHVIAAEHDALGAAARALRGEGEQAVAALHDALLCDLDAVLTGAAAPAERAAALGRFADQLEADGVVDAHGRLLLPRSVVDALYLVRVNVVLGLPALHALQPSAQRAYIGALAFHVEHAPLARRSWAAREQRALDATLGDRALAQLALYEGRLDDAIVRYEAVYASRGELRARNAARTLTRALAAATHVPTAPQP